MKAPVRLTDQPLPETMIEAVRQFADPDAAHDFFVKMRWPNGVACPLPNCGSMAVAYMPKRRRFYCNDCKRQFTAKVGTIFEDSALGLDKWLPAIWMIVNAKNGVSSCELARDLDITQKAAWHMGHRIRLAMRDGIFNLCGDVEADETFIGGRARFMHQKRKEEVRKVGGSFGMTPVSGILQRTNDRELSKVKLRVLGSVKRRNLMPHILQTVKHGSNVFTDAFSSHQGLSKAYNHEVIDHAIEYARGKVHTNGMENFWSLLKRTIKGTYVSVDPAHLFRYLDEQATRFNERENDDRGRFLSAMKRVSGRRLTYAKLTGKK